MKGSKQVMQHLNNVTAIHERRKPLMCNICVDTFGSKRSLDLVHDGQKPFKCDAWGNNSKLHIKAVHEENEPLKNRSNVIHVV